MTCVAVVWADPSCSWTLPLPGQAAPLCRRSGEEGARLAVFPEAFVGGYPKGIDFGAGRLALARGA